MISIDIQCSVSHAFSRIDVGVRGSINAFNFLQHIVDRNLILFVLMLTYIHELRIFEENSFIRRTPHHFTIPNIVSLSLLQLNSTQLNSTQLNSTQLSSTDSIINYMAIYF